MIHIPKDAPWQIFVFYGSLNEIVLLRYAIFPRKNTPPAQLPMKFAWLFSFLLGGIIIGYGLVRGNIISSDYETLLLQLSGIDLAALYICGACLMYPLLKDKTTPPDKRQSAYLFFGTSAFVLILLLFLAVLTVYY